MSVQAALAIHCYKCQPSGDEMASYMQSRMAGNTSEPPCSNVTEVVDCSQDPIIGMVADACLSVSITFNYSMIGEVTQNGRDCGVKSNCSSMLKNFNCAEMMSQSNPFMEVTQCDVSCCQEDRCNGPTSSSSSEGSSANPGSSTTPAAATLQCTKAPFNAATFCIVCLVYSAIINLF